jgi:hypothetical protein
MTKQIGRNDPCPCGSGKKYKACCLLKKGGSGIKRKLSATWLNSPSPGSKHVDLLERTFGQAVSNKDQFTPTTVTESAKQDELESTTEQ